MSLNCLRPASKRACIGFLATCTIIGCGGEKRRTYSLDASIVDSGRDSQIADATAVDANMRADSSIPTSCIVDMDDPIKLGSETTHSQRVIALAPMGSSMIAAWQERVSGINDIFAQVIPSSGEPAARVNLTANGSISSGPALAVSSNSFVLVWTDNEASNNEIYARPFSSALVPSAAAQRLTNNSSGDTQAGAIVVGDHLIASWVEADLGATAVIGRARSIGANATPLMSATAVTGSPNAPQNFLGAPLSSGGAVFVWAQSGSKVFARNVDANANPMGTAVEVSSESNAAGSIDVTANSAGAAAVFDVLADGSREEIRFRVLSETGQPTGLERILTIAPKKGRDASIVAFSGGYAVSYRALPDGTLTQTTMRVLLLDNTGDEVGHIDLGVAQDNGGRSTIRVTSDGTLVIAWADDDASGTTMNATRVRCGS